MGTDKDPNEMVDVRTLAEVLTGAPPRMERRGSGISVGDGSTGGTGTGFIRSTQAALNKVSPGLGNASSNGGLPYGADPATAPKLRMDELPETSSITEGSEDTAEGSLQGTAARHKIYDTSALGFNTGPGNEMMPEGVDWNVLGPNGQRDFDQAFEKGPADVTAAIQAGAKAESERDAELAKHYTSEAGRQQRAANDMEALRQAGDEGISRRQKELDTYTTKYTNDLANQNKFWQNPGNIISAIAYSLMPIFSNDPAIGAKLINQAIDRDLMVRKQTADMHLGELRSNLGEYRKMMGDRRLGDRLAEAEAQRIAAMDIQRIGAQASGPIAKARAETLAADFNMRAMQGRMAAWQQYHLYMAPKAMDPRMAAAYRNAGPGGFTAFNRMGTDGGPGAVKGTLQANGVAMPTTAKGPITARGPMGPDGKPGPTTQKPNADHSLYTAMKNRGVSSPKELIEALNQEVLEIAVQENKPNDRVGIGKTVNKLREKDSEAYATIGKLAVEKDILPRVTGVRRMRHDIDVIEKSYREAGLDPSKFMGNSHIFLGGPLDAQIDRYMEMFEKDHNSEFKKKADELKQAQMRFKQFLAGEVVEFYHAKAGAAQNAAETGNLKQVIGTDSPWSQVNNWVFNRSQAAQSEYAGVLRAGGSDRAALLYQLEHGVALPQLTSPGRNTGAK